jgi:hypothetical protein
VEIEEYASKPQFEHKATEASQPGQRLPPWPDHLKAAPLCGPSFQHDSALPCPQNFHVRQTRAPFCLCGPLLSLLDSVLGLAGSFSAFHPPPPPPLVVVGNAMHYFPVMQVLHQLRAIKPIRSRVGKVIWHED